MELGKKIINIRKENNLTQDDLASKYYVTRQTISNWENNKSYPDLETLVKISDDFNISLDVLLKEDKEMVKNITAKQNNYKYMKIFVILLNLLGVGCLIYFMIPYVTHDMTVKNPNAMLAGPSWDTSGFVLLLGLIPLVCANILASIFIETKKGFKVLFFIPSIVCLCFNVHYLFLSIANEEEVPDSVIVNSMKCVYNKKVYTYTIYENNGEYGLGMDENDHLPLGNVDYSSPNAMIESIENYYKSIGGSCP